MSATPRNSPHEVPLWIRATDLKELLHACPLGWFLKYVCSEEVPEFGWFVIGNAVHGAIHAGAPDFQLDVMRKWAKRYIVEAITEAGDDIVWGTGKNARTEKNAIPDSLEMIDNWYTDVVSWDRWPMYEKLGPPSQTEVVFEVDTPAGIFRSEVDAIFEDWTIIDWKTGKTPKADPIQVWAYYYGLKRAGVIPKGVPFRGGYHHLAARKPQMVDYYPGDKAVESMLIQVREMKEAMSLDRTIYPYPDFYCNYCAFRDRCPVYGGEGVTDDMWQRVQWATSPPGKETKDG